MPKPINKIKTPKQIKISARTSSVTNAFINGIIPLIQPTHADKLAALKALEISKDDVRCVYCGDEATEWDHLNALVINKGSSGYITEIANLVPSCGKCNSSKGNRNWKEWILSTAKLSPTQRRIIDIENRINILERYEDRFKPLQVTLSEHVSVELWDKHWANHKKILAAMREANKTGEEIRKELISTLKLKGRHIKTKPHGSTRTKNIGNRENNKDYTKYKFNGSTHTKGRLVLAVIKQHVQANPEIILEDLRSAFPEELIKPRNGLIVSFEEGIRIHTRNTRTTRKRHFIDDHDVIFVGGSRYVVSTQWGVENINKFIAKARSIGYRISPA